MTKAIALPIWVLLIQLLFIHRELEPESRLVCDNYYIFIAKKIYSYLLFALPFVFVAFRISFGDTWSYINTFELIDTKESLDSFLDTREKCELFYALEYYFKKYISQEPSTFIFTIAFLQSVLLIYTLRRYSEDIGMSIYIFVSSAMVLSWMGNGIRQYIVVAILFALTECILKNKWYIYIPITLILSGITPIFTHLGLEHPHWFFCGIHQSAIIVVPIFFIVRGKALSKKVWILLGVLLFLAAVGLLDSFLDTSTQDTMYADEMEYIHSDEGTNPIRVIVSAVPVLLVLIRRRDIFDSDIPSIINISINMSFVSFTLYVASMFTSGIFVGRLPAYCELYNLILFPWIIKSFHPKDQRIIKPSLYIFYFIFLLYQIFVAWEDEVLQVKIFDSIF